MSLIEYQGLPIADHERVGVFMAAAAYAGELATTRHAEFDIDVGVHGTVLAERDTFVSVIPPGAVAAENSTTLAAWGYGATVRCVTTAEIVRQAIGQGSLARESTGASPAITATRALMHASTAKWHPVDGATRFEVLGEDETTEAPEVVAVRSVGLVPVVSQLVTNVCLGTVDALVKGGQSRSWALANFRTDTGTTYKQPIQADGHNRLFFERTDGDGTQTSFEMNFIPLTGTDGGQISHMSAKAVRVRPSADRQPETITDKIQQKDGGLVVVRERRRGKNLHTTEAPASATTILAMADGAIGIRPFAARAAHWGV